MAHTQEELDAAREAAQAVVETATSWDYSAGEAKVADKIRDGLRSAGVSVSTAEFDRLVAEIDQIRTGEGEGTPVVHAASPVGPDSDRH